MKIGRACTYRAASGCTEWYNCFTGKIITFKECVNNIGRLPKPDWITQEYYIVLFHIFRVIGNGGAG